MDRAKWTTLAGGDREPAGAAAGRARRGLPQPSTPNPTLQTLTKPQTPNTKHQTPNPKPQTPNPKPQIPNSKPQITNHKPQTPNPKCLTPRQNQMVGWCAGRNSKPQNPRPEDQSQVEWQGGVLDAITKPEWVARKQSEKRLQHQVPRCRQPY